MPIETIILRILSTIALAAAVIIAVRYFRPFAAKLIFGAYSLRYVNYFKKITKTNPYPYCHKEDVPTLMAGLNPSYYKEVGVLNNNEFSFEDVPGYVTFKEIKKVYGRPLCYNIGKYKGQIIRLAGYSCDDYTAPLDIIYYFTDYGLLMGEYQFKSQNPAYKKEMLSDLLSGLKLDIPEDFNAKCYKGKNIYIYINDNGFALTVKFLNTAEFQRVVG